MILTRGAAGDLADLTLLLPPGSEVHSFEPTPQDLIEISECDLFIYNGGESDEWVEEILESLDQSKVRILRMMDCVETVEEEEKEGMYIRGEEEDGEEWDEHVWTSPYNAAQITASIGELLCQIDPDNAQQYSDQYRFLLRERFSNWMRNSAKLFQWLPVLNLFLPTVFRHAILPNGMDWIIMLRILDVPRNRNHQPKRWHFL